MRTTAQPVRGVAAPRLSNFFGRRVSAYQVGVTGEVAFGDEF